MRTQMRKLDFQGASGRIHFDENGDVSKEIAIKTIKDGKFVMAGR